MPVLLRSVAEYKTASSNLRKGIWGAFNVSTTSVSVANQSVFSWHKKQQFIICFLFCLVRVMMHPHRIYICPVWMWRGWRPFWVSLCLTGWAFCSQYYSCMKHDKFTCIPKGRPLFGSLWNKTKLCAPPNQRNVRTEYLRTEYLSGGLCNQKLKYRYHGMHRVISESSIVKNHVPNGKIVSV